MISRSSFSKYASKVEGMDWINETWIILHEKTYLRLFYFILNFIDHEGIGKTFFFSFQEFKVTQCGLLIFKL